MIITCPNCLMRYTVDPVAIGGGKMTRCSNCGHSWFQQQVAAPVPSAPPQQPAMAPGAWGAQPQPVYPPAQPMAPTVPGADGMVAPGVAPPPPQPMPEPEPEPEAEEDAGSGLTTEQLDEMFGEDDEPEPFQSVMDASDDAEMGDAVDIMYPDDLPEPEPIPEVFTAVEAGDEQSAPTRSVKKIAIIGSAVGLVVLLLAGLVFGRSLIVEWVPAVAGVYDMIGLGGSELGEGLDIRNVRSSRETEQGVEVLAVRGVVANISGKMRTVPMIKVELFDGEGNTVQTAVVAAIRNQLQPDQEAGFKARLPEPSPLARRLEVTFTDGEATEATPN